MGNQSAPNNQQPVVNNEPEKKHPLTALAFLEIGIFEIVFVIVGVLLLLGTINYFNLLPVSEVFPKYLGWLPRQQAKLASQGETLQPQRDTPSGTSRPTPTPTPRFSYDNKKAETLLTQYLKDTIKPEFLPKKIEVKYKLIGSGKEEGTEYTFGANWKIDQDFFQSNLHYQIKTNNLTDMEFLVHIPNTKGATISSTFAEGAIGKYLKTALVANDFYCGVVKEAVSFCENFKTTEDEKKGYGLMTTNENNLIFLFSCFIPKKSVFYNKSNSCLSIGNE